MISNTHPQIAVVIGLVSTEDKERIFEALASLDEQQGEIVCEVILADRRQDEISAEIARRYRSVRVIPCHPGMSLPTMRTLAFEASSAPIVAVTEDHCVPSAGWLGEVLSAMEDSTVAAVGGCVVNGVTDTPLDWATFLCEYSAFSPPVAEGNTSALPGMNVAYRRTALAGMDRRRLTEGFWETTVHPVLAADGAKFLSRNSMVMNHCKKFSFGLFAEQRFLYSRYYASLRFPQHRIFHRLASALASVLLPTLLLWRMQKAAAAKGLSREFLSASPILFAFVLIWSFGEGVGYLLGDGDSLAKIE